MRYPAYTPRVLPAGRPPYGKEINSLLADSSSLRV